jgi:hypothetical protein
MIPLQEHVLLKKSHRMRLWVLVVITGLFGGGFTGFAILHLPIVYAMDEATPWNVTLHFTEASGAGNTVVFGQKPNASDGQDGYDLPEPPSPPQMPYLLAWFQTSFPAPFERLLQEYKQYPSPRSVWNLSILWVAAPGNTSSTTISITWDSPSNAANAQFSLLLYENSTVVANMLIDHSYSFSADGTLHRFQIISENKSTDGSSEKNTQSLLPIIIGVILAISIIIVLFIAYIKRKK